MSERTVDSRVVQFSFDNSKFESNVKTSLSTIEKLKDSLNFDEAINSFDRIDKASKNVKMSGISEGVETVKASFSGLEVMAVTALANITNTVVNLGKKLVSSIVKPITQGGWNRALNIENAKFQLEGLGVAWEEIEDDINWGVKDTAYGLDSAAKVASQLVASQVGLGKEMKNALRGISGVAAMTNSTYDDIGRIFTTVAGNGRLMGDQLLQLSTRGLNAAAVLGEALGKTESEIRTMVSKGQIDFNTFAEAMDSAFGQHAKDANKTFTGAMSNVKSALARIGANFATPLMQNAVDVFNAIRVAINKVNASLQPVYDMASEGMTKMKNFLVDMFDTETPLEKLQNRIKATGTDWDKFKGLVIDSANEYYGAFSDMKLQVDGFDDALKNGKLSSEMFITAINKLLAPTKKVSESLGVASASAGEFHDIVQRVIRGDFGVGEERFRALAAAGYDYALIQNLVNQELEGTSVTIETLTDEAIEQLDISKEQKELLIELREELKNGTISIEEMIAVMNRPTKIQLAVQTFVNVLTAVKKILDSVATAWNNVFNKKKNTDGFYKLLEAVEKFSEKLIISDETAASLTKTFEGLFTIIDIIADVISTVFTEGVRVLASLFGELDGNVFALTGSFGDLLTKFKTWLDDHNVIQDSISFLADGIIGIVDTVKDWIEQFKELEIVQTVVTTVKDNVEKLTSKLKDWFDVSKDLDGIQINLKDSLDKATGKIKEWFKAFEDLPIIKDSLETLKTIATNVFDVVKEHFGKAVDRVKEFLGNLDPVSMESLKERFKEFGESIKTAFENPREAIQKFIDKLKEMYDSAKEWLSSLDFDFEAFKDNIVNSFKAIGDFFKDNAGGLAVTTFGLALLGGSYYIYEALLVLAGLNPMKPLNTLAVALNNYAKAEKMKAWATAVDIFAGAIGKLVLAFAGFAMIQDRKAAMWEFLEFVGIFAAIIGILTGVVAIINKNSAKGGLGIVNGSLAGTIDDTVLTLAALVGSIWVLANAIKVLSGIDETDMMEKIGWIGLLIAELVGGAGVTGILTHLNFGSSNPADFALPIIALAGGVWVLVEALEKIANLDAETIKTGMTRILELIGMLAGGTFVAGLSRSSAGTALTIVAFAGSLNLILMAMKGFASMKYSDINKGLTAIGGIFLRLGVVMTSTILAGKFAHRGGIAILAVSAALLLIAKAFEAFGNMDTGVIERAEAAIAPIVAVIAGLMIVSRMAGAFGTETGVMILAISAAILVLSGAVWVLSTIEPAAMWRGVGAVSIFLILVGFIISVSHFARGIQVGPIVAMTVMIGILAASVILMDKLNVTHALANAGALSMLILAVGGMFYLIGKSKVKWKAIGQLYALLGVIAVLGAIIWALDSLGVEASLATAASLTMLLLALSGAMFILSKSEFSEGQLKDAMAGMLILSGVVAILATILGIMALAGIEAGIANTASLSVLLLAMAGAMVILSKAEFSEGQLAQVMIGMGVLTLVMAGLGLVLAEVQALGVEASLANVLALVILLEAMAAAMVILSHAEFSEGQLLSAVAGMLALDLVLAGLTVVLWALQALEIDASIKNVIALSILLEAMAIAMIPLAAAGKMGFGAELAGVGGLVVLIAAMGALFLGIGELTKRIPDMETFLAKGIDIVAQIAEGIGRIFGSLVGGFIDRIAESLPGLGTSLALFGMNLSPFISAAKGINEQVITGVKNLAEVLLILSAADLVSQIATLLGGEKTTLVDFGKQLCDFGPYVRRFATQVSSIDEDAVESAANAALVLATVVEKLPYEGGVIGAIFGEKNFEGFGEGIEAFAKGIVKFQNAITEPIDEELVTSAANAGGVLAELESKLKNHGGLWQDIFGDSTLGTFAEDLPTFGKAIIKFQQSLTEPIDSQLIEDAATAAGAIAELENGLKNHGGKWQDIFGDSTLGTFAEDLPTFGKAVTDFQNALPDEIKSDLIENTKNAAGAIVELENGLKNHDGVFQMFTGDASIADFGANLKLFGESFHGFYDEISALTDFSFFSNLVMVIADLTDIDKYVSDVANDGGAYGDNLTELGNRFYTFGDAYKDYYDKIKGMFTTKLAASTVELVNLITAFKDIKNADGISTFSSGLSSLAKDGLDSFVTVFQDGATNEAMTAAQTFIGGFLDGINSGSQDVIDTFGVMLDILVTAIPEYNADFSTQGKGLIVAFAGGMSDGEDNVITAVGNLITNIVTNLTTVSAEDFNLIGQDLIANLGKGVTNKTADLASAFYNTLKNATNSTGTFVETFKTYGKDLMDAFGAGLSTFSDIANITKTISTSITDNKADFYDAGALLVDGLYDGVMSRETKASRAGRFIGMTLLSELRRTLDEHSPSREAYEIGDYFLLGLVNSLFNGESLVKKASGAVGNYVLGSFSTMMNRIAVILDSDIDLNPTITPVLDLSQIQNGVDSMNYMLGRGNYAIDGTVDAAMMAEQGVANSVNNSNQILYAILDLKKTLENLEPSVVNNYENQFNINADDPQATAEAVGDIFQHDIDRGGAVWA